MVAIAAIYVSICSATAAGLNFHDYPATEYAGKVAPLRWDESIQSAEYWFRNDWRPGERIEETASRVYRQKAAEVENRFAGHYVVLTTKCGTGIRCGLLVDLNTGLIAAMLESETSGYDFRSNSRLLVVNAKIPSPSDYHLHLELSTAYYEWNGQELVLVAVDQWPVVSATDQSGEDMSGDSDQALPEHVTPAVRFKTVRVKRLDPADLFRQPGAIDSSSTGATD